VTSSCTSVYVDGSEDRGALSAEIDVKYGAPQYMGKAVFTVWMPETPLNIDVADTRLSQIKGWKVPTASANLHRDKSLKQNETSRGETCT
jgi:transmembrane protein 132